MITITQIGCLGKDPSERSQKHQILLEGVIYLNGEDRLSWFKLFNEVDIRCRKLPMLLGRIISLSAAHSIKFR